MRYILSLILIAGLMAACGDPQVIVIEREVVVATPTSGPEPTPNPPSMPIPTPVPAPTETPTTVPTAKALSPTEIIKRSRASVVRISPSKGCGSGVLLGRGGLILTNHHVVDGQEILFATTDNGTVAPLRVVASDPSRDLALVQAITTLPEPAPLVWEDDPKLDLGTQLFVLGYPLCSDSITVTSGIFSGRTRIDGQPLLQTDAALNPGVSGGLAVSPNGRPVGIAVSVFTERENVGFLIPASEVQAQIKRWLAEFEAGRFTSPARATATPRPRPTATPRPRPTATPQPRPTATPRPRPTATPHVPTSTPRPEGPVEYVVKATDTMFTIAVQFGISVADLVEFNDLPDENFIFVGQILEVPTDPAQIIERRENPKQPTTGVVIPAEGINVRNEPNMETSVVEYVAGGGTELALTGVSKEVDGVTWWEVEDGNWTQGQYLELGVKAAPTPAATETATPSTGVASPIVATIVPESGLYVRKTASQTGEVAYVAATNTTIELSGEIANVDGVIWWQLVDGNWVQGQFLKFG